MRSGYARLSWDGFLWPDQLLGIEQLLAFPLLRSGCPYNKLLLQRVVRVSLSPQGDGVRRRSVVPRLRIPEPMKLPRNRSFHLGQPYLRVRWPEWREFNLECRNSSRPRWVVARPQTYSCSASNS